MGRRSKSFPVFTVQTRDGVCGHQHQTEHAAFNCADNQGQRTRADVSVYVRSADGTMRHHDTVTWGRGA